MWIMSPLPRNKIAWLSPQGEENACGVLALISMQFIPQPKGWGFLAWIMLILLNLKSLWVTCY